MKQNKKIHRNKMIIKEQFGFVVIIVTVLFVGACVGQDGSSNVFKEDNTGVAESRSPRIEIADQWRAVENIQMDKSGWIPDPSFQQQGRQPPKRRRLRKRKRRPPIISLTEEADVMENRYPVRRIKGPQHLHEEQELWNQMEEDAKIRPTKRRRIIPVFHENSGEKQDLEFSVDDQISVFQADEGLRGVKTPTEGVPDLKAILKQAGGLSLSEILQQKNLSLSDLLKGEKEAILAITEKPDNQVITEYKNPVEIDLPKRMQYSSNYRYTTPNKRTTTPTSVNSDSTAESSTTEGRKHEAATHRVSIKPNNVIVVDFKPSIVDLDITTRRMEPTSTTPQPTLEVRTKLKPHLPITSAKLNKLLKLTTKTSVENEVAPTTIPPKAYRINIDQLFGISNTSETTQKVNEEEGPLRMSLDLNNVLEKEVKAQFESTTTEIMPEKLKTITAKDEILDILKDEVTKERLRKVLELRNMTFTDLVELRERGSSQKHLADLFHNKTKEPEPKEEPLVGSIGTSINMYRQPVKNEIPDNQSDRQPKSHFVAPLPLESKNSNGDGQAASVVPIEESSNESKSIEETKDKEKYTVTSFPTYKIELDKKFKEKPHAVLSNTWQDNYPDVFNEFYRRTHQKGTVEDLSQKYFDDLRTVDDVDNSISESGNEKLNVEATREIYEDNVDNLFIKLPYGVKHAIFASLLIIGISLVIFLTILVIFKWSQKHKKKLCYSGSFSCSKIKSPILEDPERRSFRSFMSETLGRKKRYYKKHLQSMSDAIWENDRKSFQ